MMAKKQPWMDLFVVLGIGFAASLALFLYSIVLNHSFEYFYLVFNLALATIPLLLSWRLVVVLRNRRWTSWQPLLLTFFWIVFLPNSFYMISDFIHLQGMSSRVILYNAVMFASFIYLAMFMGLISLYQVHQELRKRLSPKTAAVLVVLLLAGCCFAIYLGRDLRWNSWDVVTNPGGLLFDISNLVLKPETYPNMGRTIASFFVIIGSAYMVSWQASRLIWHRGVNDLAAHIRRQQH